MDLLFEILAGYPKRDLGAGEIIITQGSTTGMLFFLIDGEVEVDKDEVPIATASESGSVFGEMSPNPTVEKIVTVKYSASVRVIGAVKLDGFPSPNR